MENFPRITFDPNLMGGRACIRGLRVTVALVLNLFANGLNTQQIIAEYPYLEEEDVRQVLQYAGLDPPPSQRIPNKQNSKFAIARIKAE